MKPGRGARTWLTQLFAELGKALLALVLVFGMGGAYVWWQERPVTEFCSEVGQDATPTSVLELAKAKGLRADDHVESATHTMVILNHDSPFFRFACRVTFLEKNVDKEVIAAD